MPGSSSSLSVAVLAGLLSLLPVTILFWSYYLRARTPSVPGRTITRFFAVGMLVVVPSILLERLVFLSTQQFSPVAASVLFAESFALDSVLGLVLAVGVSFGVVALAEEGMRFLLLRFLFRRSAELDQVVDGLQVGVASGIGFAFVENTLYFLRLLERLDFDTLAVVFFLRFLISTFGHIAFGGIMGYQLALAAAEPLERRARLSRAFLIPWIVHGLFDLFLSVQLSAYAVILLLLPLLYLWSLYRYPKLHERFRLHGRLLRAPVQAGVRRAPVWRRPPVDPLPTIPWCPTCCAPLPDNAGSDVPLRKGGRGGAACPVCGTQFTQAAPRSVLPLTASPPR